MSIIALTRITIETTSPLSVYSGDRSILSNDALSRDWNGLPYIPATSLTGVWRSILETDSGSSDVDYWFGVSKSRDDSERMASRIIISDARMLNCRSTLPNDGEGSGVLLSETYIHGDRLLAKFTEEHDKDFERMNCRINGRKTALNKALHKTMTLPRGIRFFFNIKAELDSEEDIAKYHRLLKTLSSSGFALGSKTSIGHGRFKIIGLASENIDLADYRKNTAEFTKKITEFTGSCSVPLTIPKEMQPDSDAESLYITPDGWNFEISAKGSWRAGTGRRSASKAQTARGSRAGLLAGETVDDNTQRCFTDGYVKWVDNEFDAIDYEILVPGSTVKGVIAHRTLYHYLRLKRLYAGCNTEGASTAEEIVDNLLNNQTSPEILEEYCQVFGRNDPQNPDRILAGSLRIGDCKVDCSGIISRMHNKIDRFTGGVIPSALFSQEKLINPIIKINLQIRKDRFEKIKNSDILEALKRTIYDLKHGYLNICAGSGRDTAIFTEKSQGEHK